MGRRELLFALASLTAAPWLSRCQALADLFEQEGRAPAPGSRRRPRLRAPSQAVQRHD